MSEIYSRLVITSALVSSLAIFGCSSSDDGGGSTLTTITEANAAELVAAATESGMAFVDIIDVFAVDVDQGLSAMDVINTAIDKVKIYDGGRTDVPLGVAFSQPCSGGGSISGDETDTSTATTESITGVISFLGCIEFGITLNGTINYDLSRTISTLDYSGTFTGNISGTDGIDSASITGMDFNITGNDNFPQPYSMNRYSFTAVVSGTGGFSTTLLAPIAGDEAYNCPINPMSGIILVTGASNTQAKGTINSVGNVTIEFNDGTGTFTEVPGSPFPCSDFFV